MFRAHAFQEERLGLLTVVQMIRWRVQLYSSVAKGRSTRRYFSRNCTFLVSKKKIKATHAGLVIIQGNRTPILFCYRDGAWVTVRRKVLHAIRALDGLRVEDRSLCLPRVSSALRCSIMFGWRRNSMSGLLQPTFTLDFLLGQSDRS